LQLLRSRKGLGGDDYQRVYSQGQFMRQMMLNHFNKFTGILGNLFIRAGLLFVETNMNADDAIGIVGQLEKNNFPKSPDDIIVRVRPAHKIKYKVFDFSDEDNV
jgi:hypothetical protein